MFYCGWQVDPKKDVVLDVSSTSSEESDNETPLTQLNTQEMLAKVGIMLKFLSFVPYHAQVHLLIPVHSCVSIA